MLLIWWIRSMKRQCQTHGLCCDQWVQHWNNPPTLISILPRLCIFQTTRSLCWLWLLLKTTHIDVWVGYKLLLDESLCTPLRSTRIKLNKGDLLVFFGDCIHTGSAYDLDNIRLHCYFPIFHTDVSRPDNQTHQVHRLHGEFSYLRGLVDEELREAVVTLRMRHSDRDF